MALNLVVIASNLSCYERQFLVHGPFNCYYGALPQVAFICCLTLIGVLHFVVSPWEDLDFLIRFPFMYY